MKAAILRDLEKLCAAPRPAGSAAHAAACDYAAAALEAAGWRVTHQPFDCVAWTDAPAALTVGGRSVPAQAAPYAAPCEAEGRILRVGTLEELRVADLTGAVALFYGALRGEGICAKNSAFWNPEEHQEIHRLLERGRPVALLTESLSPDGLTAALEDGDCPIPCAVISQADASTLRDGETARLVQRTVRRAARADNILATLGAAPRKIALTAHIDSKPYTPGALDNAGGVAVLLDVARRLGEGAWSADYAIELTLFGGEDVYDNRSELTFIAENLNEPQRYLWAANIDGAGSGATGVSFYACPDALTARAKAAMAELGGFADMEPWPQGDHTLFVMSGVPALALTSADIFSTPMHTAADTVEKIDLDALEGCARLLERLARG